MQRTCSNFVTLAESRVTLDNVIAIEPRLMFLITLTPVGVGNL